MVLCRNGAQPGARLYRRSAGAAAAVASLLALAGCSTHSHSPAAAESWYHQGQSAVQRKNYPAAEAAFAQARDLAGDPDRAAWAQYQIAACYEAQPSRRAQALEALQTLIHSYPHHFLSGRAQEDLDRMEGKKSRPFTPPPLDKDCGPECLAYLLSHSFHRSASIPAIARLAGTSSHGTTLLGLQKAAQAQGLKAEGMKVDEAFFRHVPQPTICWVRRSHYVAVLSTVTTLQPPFWAARVYDPTIGKEEVIAAGRFSQEWDGYALALSAPTALASR